MKINTKKIFLSLFTDILIAIVSIYNVTARMISRSQYIRQVNDLLNIVYIFIVYTHYTNNILSKFIYFDFNQSYHEMDYECVFPF